MNKKITYYKGLLKCQYLTVDPQKIGNSSTFTKQSKFTLEPRFFCYDVEVIGESEYPEDIEKQHVPYIRQVGEYDVEFNFKGGATDSINSSKLVSLDEIILILNRLQHSVDSDENFETYQLDQYLHQDKKELPYYTSFNAMHGKDTHGRIMGTAFFKKVEYLDENNKPVFQEKKNLIETIVDRLIKGPTIPVGDDSSGGCFGRKKGNNSFFGRILGNPDGSGGCFGGGANGIAGSGNNTGGCFSPNSPIGGIMGNMRQRGCFGQSANPMGCLWPLLALILLLALLLSLFRGCNKQSVAPAPVVIHDTLKVEVEKIDTLEIIKTDTLSYVDSTVKLNYETVNLPNVQFVTNSDTLLPSSAEELSRLAAYLIKNDSLTATIIGHTDTVGKPSENMALSLRRAQSVKRFLESLNVQANRLQAVGKGDTEPKADNNTLEGRLMNRRVEVQLTKTSFVNTTRTKKDKQKNNSNG